MDDRVVSCRVEDSCYAGSLLERDRPKARFVALEAFRPSFC
jgi:hypothetical protein